jgi:prepilin-type N-terminal cleavage/methylation domain-containing protein
MRSQHGFSLMEMMIVIIIMGIIIGMSSSLLNQGLNIFSPAEGVINANWQGQLAMERFSRDALSIRSSADVTTMTANNFAFTDINSNTIAYSLSGTNLILTYNGSSLVLADGIQSLTFSYFDKTGTSTASLTAMRYVRITINVTQNNANYTLTTLINPRNLI